MALLNAASAIYAGTVPAQSVYLGDTLVWSSGFNPGSIANLSLWLDAADIAQFTFPSGVLVSQWRDKSARALHMDAPPGAQPSRSGSRNGKPTVVFGGAQYLDRMAATGFSVAALTVFIVFAETDHQIGNSGILSLYPPGGDDWNSPSAVAIEAGEAGYVFQVARAPAIARVTTSMMSGWGIARSVLAPEGTVSAYANGVLAAQDNGVDSWGSPGGIILGARYFSGAIQTSYRLIGDIGEVILYDRVLTDPETATVEDYLRQKWSIT